MDERVPGPAASVSIRAKPREKVMRRVLQVAAIFAAVLGYGAAAQAADIKVLTTGAMKEVVLAVVPAYERATGNKVVVSNDTAGALVKRIEGGEGFDLCVL